MATVEEIKALRDETGVSVMQCKKALEESGGDVEKARVILTKESASAAAKKSDRVLGSGVATAYVHAGGSVVGAIVLACESDFVAKNEDFKKLAYNIAMHVAAMNPRFLNKKEAAEAHVVDDATLLDQPFIKDGTKTVRQLIEEAIQKFGEKIEIVRFERLSIK